MVLATTPSCHPDGHGVEVPVDGATIADAIPRAFADDIGLTPAT